MYSYSKYRAKRVVYEGITFDSMAERELYKEIKYQVTAFQPKVYLTDARILCKPDFKIEDKKQEIWIEMKGFETPTWRIKRRLWMYYGPGELHLYKMKSGRPYLYEKIIPGNVDPILDEDGD